MIDLIDLLCFNSTLSNISAISWRPVLAMEEARVPEKLFLSGLLFLCCQITCLPFFRSVQRWPRKNDDWFVFTHICVVGFLFYIICICVRTFYVAVELPNNSCNYITNTTWVRTRICILQKGCTRLAVTKLTSWWFSPGTTSSLHSSLSGKWHTCI